MQHKPTTHPAENQGPVCQDQLHEMLKGYRLANNHTDFEWAVILDELFHQSIRYWAEAYQNNCFELLEVLTDQEVQRRLHCPNDHILMITRFLKFLTFIEPDIERYSSYVDNGLMSVHSLGVADLAMIEERCNKLYNCQTRQI
jgi:hypothetical protein